MSRGKKAAILIAAFVLLLFGLWMYWEREISLTEILPDASWTKVRLLAGDPDSQEREQEFASPPLDEILAAADAAKVTRDRKNPYLSDKYFQLYLYREAGDPTVIYVKNTGQIIIAADLDHYRYYEGGEEFYEALSAICVGLVNVA